MSRTIYTPCHITIFNLFLLSYYISFKRLLIFQQLLHCPNQYWKNVQHWEYTVCQACSLDYSLLTPRWVSFLCTKLASGSNRTHMSEIWRNRAGNQLWLLLVIVSSNNLMPMALLTYIVVCIVRCIMLSEKSKLVPKSLWINPESWSWSSRSERSLCFLSTRLLYAHSKNGTLYI